MDDTEQTPACVPNAVDEAYLRQYALDSAIRHHTGTSSGAAHVIKDAEVFLRFLKLSLA